VTCDGFEAAVKTPATRAVPCKPASGQQWGLLVACLVVAAAVQPARAATCSLADLEWMAADWVSASEPARSQERWTLAAHGVLMGSSFSIPEGKAGFAELMTIRPESDGISMVLRHFDGALGRASEPQTEPMIFKAASCEPMQAIFDGHGAHAGGHLTYRRTGDDLLIVGDFIHQGQASRAEWRMVRRSGAVPDKPARAAPSPR
jgi:hypothetical protein